MWTENDIRFKARFDYLKPKAIVDLKTFGNFMNKPIDSAIYSAMASGKYHIQAAFYMRAFQAARSHSPHLVRNFRSSGLRICANVTSQDFTFASNRKA